MYTKSMKNTNKNCFALANSEEEEFPRVEYVSTWAWNFSDAVKQKLISLGISSMHCFEMSFEGGGQTNSQSLWLSKLYNSTFLLHKRVKYAVSERTITKTFFLFNNQYFPHSTMLDITNSLAIIWMTTNKNKSWLVSENLKINSNSYMMLLPNTS